MGEKHGHDRAAALHSQTLVDREREQHAACLQRWPTIVARMRALIAGYNEGAGRSTVTLVEDSVNSGVTLESAGHSRSLVMTLDGTDVAVRTRNGHADPVNETHWVSLNRTDEEAAAYLLRNWMEQLKGWRVCDSSSSS
jgi:hypothetical protein